MNAILLVVALFMAYKLYENLSKIGCKCDKCGKNIKCDEKICIYCGAKNTHQTGYANTQEEANEKIYDEVDASSQQNSKDTHYNYYDVEEDLDGIIVALMSKVAQSNDVLTKDEATYISQRYLELAKLTNKTPNVIDIYEEIFARNKNKSEDIEEYAIKLKELDEAPKAYVFKILEELTKIDGDYEVLDNIKAKMEFAPSSSNSYYEILNSKPTDDWERIKANYKELVKEYHYDKLISKNLPKDLLEYSEKRLKEINEAYDHLKKLKNK